MTPPLHPLERAACAGNVDLVRQLLRDVRYGRSVLASALVAMAERRKASDATKCAIAKLLLSRIRATTEELEAALDNACSTGSARLVRLLLGKPRALAIPKATLGGWLQAAVYRGDFAVFEALVQAGPVVVARIGSSSQWLTSAVEYVVCADDLDELSKAGMLEVLFAKGASAEGTNRQLVSPLENALDRGELNIAELLVDRGASVDRTTARQRRTLLMRAVVDYGEETNDAARLPLLQRVQDLLQFGANPLAQNPGGITPRQYAIDHALAPVVALMP